MISYTYGFDISTSVIGWAIFRNGSYFDSGYIKFKQGQNLYEKADFFSSFVSEKFDSHPPSKVLVEQPKLGFSTSTAKTLSTLQRFNGIASYVIYERSGVVPEMVDERNARKAAGLKIVRFAKNDKNKIKDKHQVGNQVIRFDWFPKDRIQYKKTGKIKDEIYDETDAIILCLAKLSS